MIDDQLRLGSAVWGDRAHRRHHLVTAQQGIGRVDRLRSRSDAHLARSGFAHIPLNHVEHLEQPA